MIIHVLLDMSHVSVDSLSFLSFWQACVANCTFVIKIVSISFRRNFSILRGIQTCFEGMPMDTHPRDRSRSPPAGSRPGAQRKEGDTPEEIPKLETHLQLVEAYLKDIRKLQVCQQTLLDIQQLFAQQAYDVVKEHTAKIGKNPLIFDTPPGK